MTNNYDTAIKIEAKKVIRCFHHYSSDDRARHAASHRLSPAKRKSEGEHFYIHPALPNKGFPTRSAAAQAALRACE